METKGQRLQQIRKQLGYSQEDVGKELGVSKATVSRWESGTREVSEQVIRSYRNTFGASMNYIREGKGEPFVLITKTDSETMDAMEKRLLAYFRMLNATEKADCLERLQDKLKK